MASRESGHAHIRISPDTKRFAGELREQLRKINVNYDVDVRPDTDTFDAELRSRLAAMRHEVEVDVDANMARFDAEMADATALGRHEATIDVEADTRLAEMQIDRAARDRHATIHARVDGAATRHLATIERRLGNISVAARTATGSLTNLGGVGGEALSSLGGFAERAHRNMGTLQASSSRTFQSVNRGAAGATRSLDGLGAAAYRTHGTMRRMMITAGVLGTAISVLGVGIAGLVPVTLSAGAAIGQFAISTGAALGSVALPAVTGLGLAFFALRGSFTGMGAAIAGEAAEAAEALAELPPEARAAALAMRDLKDEFEGFSDTLKTDFWGEFNNIGQMESLIVPVKNALTDVAAETGHATRGLVAFMTAGAGLMATEDLIHGAGRATGQLAQATMNVVEGLISIGGAAAPVYNDMIQGLSGVTRGWSQNLSLMYQTGELQARIREHAENMAAGWQTFTGAMSTMGGIIAGVWRAVEGSGNAAYEAVARVFNETHAWVDSMAGQSTLRDFFADAQDVAVGLLGTIGHILSVIGTLAPAMADALTGFGPGMRELVDGLETGLSAIIPHVGGLASGLGSLAGALSPMLPLVGELGGALLSVLGPALEGAATVLSTLSPLIEGVTSVLSAMPAPITAIVAAWAAMKFIPSGILAPITKATGNMSGAFQKAGGAFQKFRQDVAANQQHFASMGRGINSLTASAVTLVERTPALQRAWDAYDRGAASLNRVAAAHRTAAAAARANVMASRNAFATIDYMGQQAGHSFVATTARMGAAASGMARGGMSLLRSGAGGVINMLGGPWGAAMLGAGIAIGELTQALAAAEQAQENIAVASREAEKAQRDLAIAVAGTTGALGEQGLAAASTIAAGSMAELVEQGQAQDRWWNQSGTRFATATSGLGMVTNAYRMLRGESSLFAGDLEQLQGTGANSVEVWRALKDAMTEAGISQASLNDVIAEGGAEYQNLYDTLASGDTASQAAAAALQDARREVELATEAAQRLPENFGRIAESIDTLADSSSSATDRLSALRTMLDEMGGGAMSQQDALMQAAQYVDEIANSASRVVDASAGLGDSLFDGDMLDASNANARALHEELSTLADEFTNLANSGVPAEEAMGRLQPVFDRLVEDFQLTERQAERLREQFGLMPDRVETLLSLEGGDDAMQQLAAVWAQIESMPPGTTHNVEVLADEAADALRELGIQVEEVRNADGTVIGMDVTAETAEAQQKLDDFAFIAAQLGTTDINPTVWLDDTPLRFTADQAQRLLDDLDYTNPTPEADIIIDNLLNGKEVSMQELAILAAQTADPDAILHNGALMEAADNSSLRLSALHEQRTEPTISANNAPARTAIDNVKSWLAGIKDKVVNIFVRRSGDPGGSIEFASGGLFGGPAYATGGLSGALPAYATGDRHPGYRLPTSGPGTDVTDGFLAFTGGGAPAAWLDAGEWIINRRSSEKYHNELRAINNGTFPKLPGYADGGRYGYDDTTGMEDMTGPNVLRWVRGETMFGVRPPGGRSLDGARYVFGGGSPNDWGDCSGSLSLIAGLLNGMWATKAMHRLFATANMSSVLPQMGWTMGAAPTSEGYFEVGWYNGGPGGGHATGNIDGTNVEMGGGNYVGGQSVGAVGGGAASPSAPQFTNRAHIALAEVNDLYGPGGEYRDDYDDYEGTRTVDDYVYGTDSRKSRDYSERDPMEAETWSDAAGDVAHAAVSGQFKDAFEVLGIPDELPPALRAAREAREFEEERRNPGSTKSGSKPRDVEKDRQKAADLDQKVEYAEDELEIARTRRDETYNKTNAKGEKTATESQKQQADLQVKKAEDKLEKAKRERAEFERERGGAEPERGDADPSDEVVYRPGGGAEQWMPVIVAGLRRMGLPESLAGITRDQIDIESGGDPNAQNNWDINAKRGDPSGGLLQVIRSTFTAMRRLFPEANEGLPDDQMHPLANVVAALGWTVHKYGGPQHIWPTRNGYATGGRVWGAGGPKDDKIPAMLSDGEFVVNSEATSRNLPVLERINSGMPLPASALAAGDLPPGVRNARVAPNLRRKFATGGLVGVDVAKLWAEIASKAGGAGLTILSGAMSGATGGAAPGGDGTVEGEIIRRVAGAAHATTGHLATFARDVGGSLVNDLVGSAFTGAPDNVMGDILAAAEKQALTAQNLRAATPQVVTTTTTNNGGAGATTYNLYTDNVREGFRQATLKDWQNKALTHAGGRG